MSNLDPSLDARPPGPALPPGGATLRPGLHAAALTGLAALAGLGFLGLPGSPAAWIATAAGFLLLCAWLERLALRHYPHTAFGACNGVTLFRAALAAALVPPLLAGAAPGWAVAAIATVALALDGLDGWLARRSGLASVFGARFDMEVDAALALILALHAFTGTAVGPEVLLLGLARYAFVTAMALWPWLGRPLPERFRRKAVCVFQLATLILLLLPPLPPEAAVILARIAAAALACSFGTDILWLSRHRP